MSSAGGPGVPDLKSLLDEATSIATMNKRVKLQKTQINNLLEVLESEENDEDALLLTAAFTIRQASRNYIDPNVAKRIAQYLLNITQMDVTNKKEIARKFLGFIKWMTEIIEGAEKTRQIPPGQFSSFQDFIKSF